MYVTSKNRRASTETSEPGSLNPAPTLDKEAHLGAVQKACNLGGRPSFGIQGPRLLEHGINEPLIRPE